MSISIDGKVHKGSLRVKYGDEFPKQYSNTEIDHPSFGHCKIYIIWTGRPEWNKKMYVTVPMKFHVTQIIEKNEKYQKDKKKKSIGLQLVKG